MQVPLLAPAAVETATSFTSLKKDRRPSERTCVAAAKSGAASLFGGDSAA
jgi:hypothetical protein